MKKQPCGCRILFGYTFSFRFSNRVIKSKAANAEQAVVKGCCIERTAIIENMQPNNMEIGAITDIANIT